MHAPSSTSSHEAASRVTGSDSAASDRASSSSANASTTNSSTAAGGPAVAGNGRPGPVLPPGSDSRTTSSPESVGAVGPRPQAVPPAVPEQAPQATTTSDIFPARHVALPSTGADPSTSDHSSAPHGRPLFSSLGTEPRSARISSEPPIPADIHLMLITTPPPRPTQQQLQQRELNALRGGLYSATGAPGSGRSALSTSTTRQPPQAREDENVAGLALRMKAFRFLGGGGGSEKSNQSSSSRSRQRPGTFADWMRPPDARTGGAGGSSAGQQTLDSPEREKRRRTTGERKNGKMDSKTPADSVPKTWSDYALAYALGQMDVSDPPFPPVEAQQIGPSPYDVAHFPAPLDLAPTSAIRNRLIEHLDLLGRNRRFSTDTLSSSHGTSGDPRRGSRTAPSGSNVYSNSPWRSLVGDTALRSLLSRALYTPLGTPALFKPAPKAAMITLFPPSSEPTAPVTILASINLPHNLSIPLSHAIDAHVLLNGECGLIVPDTERDWRWRGNDLVCSRSFTMPGSPYNPGSSDDKSLGIRFYAAMPIFAPSMPELASFEEEAGGRIAIGTIAVLDDWPRLAKFGSTERAKL